MATNRIDIVVQARQTGGGGVPASAGGSGGSGQAPGLPAGLPQIPAATSAVQGLTQAFGALAALGIAQQFASWAVAAGGAAIAFDKANSTAKLLSGTTQDYNKLVQLAKQNQLLFGGSLTTNIQALSGFANMARRTGVELGTFNDLAARLNLISPEQGLEGAAVALREAFSGDTQSLVERFELPRAAVSRLRDASLTAAERVKILNDVLTDQGAPAGAAAAGASQLASGFNRLNAEIEATNLSLGKAVAEGFNPAANGLARLIGLINNNPQAIAELKTLFGGGTVQNNLKQVEAELLAKDQQTGFQKTSQVGSNRFNRQVADPGELQQAQAAFEAATATAARLSATSASAAEAVRSATDAYRDTGNLQQYALALAVIEQQQRNQSGVTVPAYIAALQSSQSAVAAQAQAERDRATAISTSIQQDQQRQLQQQQQIAIEAQLTNLSQQVALGNLTQADAVRILSAQYPALAGQAAILIDQQLKLADATKLATLELAGQGALSGVGKGIADITKNIADQRRKVEAGITSAQRDQALATGTNTQKLAIYRKELAGLVPGSAAYIRKQTEIKLLEQQIAAEREAAAKKGDKSLASQQKALASSLETIENRYQDHYRRLAQMQEDYNLRAQRDTEDFQDQRRKLLAEGRIFEAQQLQKEFDKEQRRAAEDLAIQRQRQEADLVNDVANTQEKAAIKGVNVGGSPPPDRGALPGGMVAGNALAGGGAASGGNVVQVVINGTVTLDGQAVGRLVAPTVEQELMNGLLTLQIVAPPNAPGKATGGPRP